MSKQKDRLDLATKYIVDDRDRPTTDLDKAERKTVEHLRLCYNYINENPLTTKKELRDHIMKQCGVTDIAAYRYISLMQMLIGEQSLEGKNFAKMKVAALLDEEYVCLKNEDYAAANARHKLIQDYVKSFHLDKEEGETLNLARLLEERDEQIVFTTDVSVLGIHHSEKELKEMEELKRKYGYKDIEFSSIDDINGDEMEKRSKQFMEKYGIEDTNFEELEGENDREKHPLQPS